MRDYRRIANLLQSTVWLIEPNRGQVMADAFLDRIEAGPRAQPFLSDVEAEQNRTQGRVRRVPMPPSGKAGRVRDLAIIPLIGAVLPRGDMMSDMSGGGAINLTQFQNEFMSVADDESVGAILLEIDSPGGQIDMVPETANMIYRKRKAGRPIIAVANTMAASAAYWIASAADEIVATPSSMVGSIGVFQMHQNLEAQAEMLGVKPFYIYEGARKVEGNPFEPMTDVARAAYQAEVRAAYEAFTTDVATYRGASVRAVRADPEGGAEKSFGGGRAYSATRLKSLGLIGAGGMVDRVDTMEATVDRLMRRTTRRASTARAKLVLNQH